MPTIETIRKRLAAHEPTILSVAGQHQAAVAIVFCEGAQGPELLFIERARHPDDPWSGHMAFPGGRLEAGDRDPRQAAERETREEVGLSLNRATYLGRLDDMEGRHAGPRFGMVISAHVYHLSDPETLAPNHEVEQAFWFPVSGLLEAERYVEYPAGNGARFPGILVGIPERHVVWGLTYRFLEVLMRIAGQPIPERWTQAS